jgi:cobyrinic acid a,c-diamide synthase
LHLLEERAVHSAIGISAIGTGEGKTLVALGLSRALVRAGYAVSPFKSGPDYLDAQLYVHACGARARNLDLWLDGRERVKRELDRARKRGTIAVIEGMMGLFDGDDLGETSSAHIFSENRVPVILVVDGWRMSQSAAAVALGCVHASPRVDVLGVVLNRCAGESQERAVRRACEREGIRLLAALPYDTSFVMPERHLGINVTAVAGLSDVLDRVADLLDTQLSYDSLFGPPRPEAEVTPARSKGPIVAYADDEALSFTYPQTLDALAQLATVVPFSPLHDDHLPEGTSALWLGGGYPEAYSERLSSNASLLREIRDAATNGVPVYAECGGMMLLAKTMETPQGRFPMAGVLDVEVSIAQPRLVIGYRSMTATGANVLDRNGDQIRGYEFHYASARYAEEPAYGGGTDPGARRGRTLAAFVHRRFHEGDETLCRFIDSAR